jgi:hypothetical protein
MHWRLIVAMYVVDQLQATLRDERTQWEAEKQSEINAQMESMKEEMFISSKQLREELQQERSVAHAYRQQIDALQEVSGPIRFQLYVVSLLKGYC